MFMYFLGSTSTILWLWSVFLEEAPLKNPLDPACSNIELHKRACLGVQYINFYGRLLHAWLHPDLNTISNNHLRENSLQVSVYGIGFWCAGSEVRILSEPYISARHGSNVSLSRTLFVRR